MSDEINTSPVVDCTAEANDASVVELCTVGAGELQVSDSSSVVEILPGASVFTALPSASTCQQALVAVIFNYHSDIKISPVPKIRNLFSVFVTGRTSIRTTLLQKKKLGFEIGNLNISNLYII